MKWLKRLFTKCDHSWRHRRIYGDERLHLGRIEEWQCEKCFRITGKNPKVSP